MVQTERILWLDLETTGNKPESEIIEVGVAVTDATPRFGIYGATSLLVKPSPDWVESLSPVVLDMHTKNGLIEDIRAKYGTLSRPYEIDADLGLFLDEFAPGSEHVPFAGSGVMHFDRQYIKRDFPKFDKRITYWAYDMGVIRRFLQLTGVDAADRPVGQKTTHRALDDVYEIIDDARRYAKLFEVLKLPVNV